MTEKCIDEIIKLEDTSDLFNQLSVEQLIFAAMIGTDTDEPKSVLEITSKEEWEKWMEVYRKKRKTSL